MYYHHNITNNLYHLHLSIIYILQDKTTTSSILPLFDVSQDCPNFTIKKYPFLNDMKDQSNFLLDETMKKKKQIFPNKYLTIARK